MDSKELDQAAATIHSIAEKQHVAEIEAEQPPAAERLRAFEDKVLGKDAVRIDGKIERGIGSAYSKMKPDDRKSHAALEALIAAEERLSKANAEMSAAKINHAAAMAKAGA